MAAGHKGLGKGLGSLFGEELTETQGTVSQVELRQIEPNPAQPRPQSDSRYRFCVR